MNKLTQEQRTQMVKSTFRLMSSNIRTLYVLGSCIILSMLMARSNGFVGLLSSTMLVMTDFGWSNVIRSHDPMQKYKTLKFDEVFIYHDKFINFLKLAGLLIYMYFFVVLWSVLLVVPGIIKFYSWSQAHFIYRDLLDKGEDPSYKSVLQLSEQMMEGHKMSFFFLHLYVVIPAILVAAVCIVVFAFVAGFHLVGLDGAAFIVLLLYWLLIAAGYFGLTFFGSGLNAHFYEHVSKNRMDPVIKEVTTANVIN